jgi:hypothetical protein
LSGQAGDAWPLAATREDRLQSLHESRSSWPRKTCATERRGRAVLGADHDAHDRCVDDAIRLQRTDVMTALPWSERRV